MKRFVDRVLRGGTVQLPSPARVDRTTGLLLLLALAILLPVASMVWFMNAAATGQAENARRSVTEAYRGQLRLLGGSVEELWSRKAAALQASADSGRAGFEKIVTSQLADSAVFLNSSGAVIYPPPASLAPPELPSGPDWTAARILEQQRQWPEAASAYGKIAVSDAAARWTAQAAQAQIRCVLQTGDNRTAIRLIRQWFLGDTGRLGPGGAGLAADELLLGLRLMASSDARRGPMLARFQQLLMSDSQEPISSPQRLFLMREAKNLPEKPEFPSFAAEEFAAQFLQSEPIQTAARGLQPTSLPDVWRLSATSPGGSVQWIALFRTSSVVAASMPLLAAGTTGNAVFALLPPGSAIMPEQEATGAGSLLPGWQIAFQLQDPRALEAEQQRHLRLYLGGGYLVIAVIVVLGLLLGRALRRQMILSRLKTDLVAAVSHELKTPLASMRLLVDSLLEDDVLDPRKTREYLRLIAGENHRLTRLAGNFLEFTRIERNRQRFAFADADPIRIVEDAVAPLRDRFAASGVRLEVSAAPGLPWLRADADALASALRNLLENASKYSPHDPDADEPRVALRVETHEKGVMFSVADNGIGIPVSEHQRIFQKFYQVDQRLARSAGGCGLGLSIAASIVRAHGGSIQVESEVGKGSTFSIILPAGPVPLAALDRAPA